MGGGENLRWLTNNVDLIIPWSGFMRKNEMVWHNSPIYYECQTQSADVLALSQKRMC